MNQDERHAALLDAGIGPECAVWDKTYAPCPSCGLELYCGHCEWCKGCGTVYNESRFDDDGHPWYQADDYPEDVS